MKFNEIKKFFFLEHINTQLINSILQFKNLSLIYYPKKDYDYEKLVEICKFSKKNKINLYLKNNVQLAIKLALKGVYISSDNKKANVKSFNHRKIEFIGVAHNLREFFFKKKQNCNLIFLSPLFFNNKFSKNKTLGIKKFMLLKTNLNYNFAALGGIQEKDINKLNLMKVSSFGFVSLLYKKSPLTFFKS
ncbi:thiamine phosphate synthase [Candidatus Fonsibacter ubiquis]|uniref:thiamine phosphate synthase n=1 Tax=Candidatus Fonsibacter ubiquis TaxID=1925548 RepID=UPI000C06D015|nr:thiamine phosphate synthase [Candidatus Fonsibacter ubiquis]